MVFIAWFGVCWHILLEQELSSERHGPCWKLILYPQCLDVEAWVQSRVDVSVAGLWFNCLHYRNSYCFFFEQYPTSMYSKQSIEIVL